jgi:hypothetical protein
MGPEVVFREFSSILDQEPDLSFASTMVQVADMGRGRLLGLMIKIMLIVWCIIFSDGGAHQLLSGGHVLRCL